MATNFWSDKIQLLLKGIRFKGGATIDSTTRENLTYTDSLETKLLKKDNYELYFEDFKDTFPVAYFNEAVSMTKVNETDSTYASNTVGRINQTGATTTQFVETNPIVVVGADWTLEPIKLEVMQSVTGVGTWSMVLMTSTDGISYTANTSAVEITDKKNYKLILQLASDITHVKVRWIIGTPDNATILRIGRIAIMSNAFEVGQTTIKYSVDARGNNGASVTAGNPINFTEVADTQNRFDGTQYIVAKNQSVVSIKYSIIYSGSTNMGIEIYKNGVNYKRMSDPLVGVSTISGSFISSIGEFQQGDLITVVNTQGTATLSNDTSLHYLNIVEEAYADNVIVDAAAFNADSMIRFAGGNGHGSTNTKIARFLAPISNRGTDITYADSATLGGTFTINKSGTYFLTGTLNPTNAQQYLGFSVNSAQLTTNIQSITKETRLSLAAGNSGTEAAESAAWSGYLNEGDIVRFHTDGATFGANELNTFTIAKMANPPAFLQLDVSSERENVYSVEVSALGVPNLSRMAPNYKWFDGITKPFTAQYIVDITSLGLTVPPKVDISPDNASSGFYLGEAFNVTATSFEYRLFDVNGSGTEVKHNIEIRTWGADYKSPQAFIAGSVALTEANTSGIEYKTNEKMNGQWVYAKTFDQSLPSGTVLVASGATKLISTDGTYEFTPTRLFSLPHNDNSTYWFAELNPSTGVIAWVGSSTKNIFVTIKYLK